MGTNPGGSPQLLSDVVGFESCDGSSAAFGKKSGGPSVYRSSFHGNHPVFQYVSLGDCSVLSVFGGGKCVPAIHTEHGKYLGAFWSMYD